MTNISDIAHGRTILTPRMKRQRYVNYVKTKSKALGKTINKNVVYMGKKTYAQRHYLKSRPLKKVKIKSSRKLSHYKKKGKKFIPVYKKTKHIKHRAKPTRSNYDPFNPFGLSI